MNRTCPRCKESKPLDLEHFGPNPNQPHGLEYPCRPCKRVMNQESRARRRAKRLSAAKPVVKVPTVEDFEITIDEPIPDPIETAYAERAERKEKTETKKQRDALLDENERLKKRIGQLVEMQRPAEILVYKTKASERTDATACAILSDWHVDEIVERHVVHGLNEYSPEIAKQRAEACFRNLLTLTNILARDSVVGTISLSLLGDFFSGHIHDELKASTAMAPGDAARFAKTLLISGIEFLLRESPYRIEADCIPGNHGRMTDQVWFSDPTGTSLETFMYHAIAGRFHDNPRVNINVAAQAMVYRQHYESFRVRKCHGYEVKFGGGVGGFTIPILKKIAAWDQGVRASYTEVGHFHRRFDGGTFGVNGSLIGYNGYAQAIGASPEPPEQQFYSVLARNGGVKSIVAPIFVTDARKEAA